jgi:DNA-binding transcriptional MerR regulator
VRFSIGEFARHGRVSVRMLRHYDAIGLLRPAYVDPVTGYRSYEVSQLAELNRLIALKDLGFTLQQVQAILAERVSAAELRGMLVSGALPAGRNATFTHVGHPAELVGVTESLLDWAAAQGLTWDMSAGEGGERWGGRAEIYLTDPGEEPDLSKWVTQLAFRLAD